MPTPRENAKMKIGEPVSEVWVACINCAGKTLHKVVKSISQWDELQPGDRYRPPMQSFHTFELIQCMGCERPSYRETDLYDFYLDEDEKGIPDERLHPPRLEGRKRMKEWHTLPEVVRYIYYETHLALSAGQSILTGMGIRAIIESVCREKGTKGTNLCQMIDGLVTEGELTQKQADVLHDLRKIGNDAAHEALSQTPEVFNAAFEVVEHLLMGIYIVPTTATRIMKSRTST